MASKPDNPYNLSPKRWRFVQEYLRDLNGTQACIRAGYSSKRADQQAYELLTVPEVSRAVEAEKDRIAAELECTRGDIMLELQAIAFAKMSDFGVWLADGSLLIKEMDDIPRHLQGAIQKVENHKSYDKDGNLLKEQIKLWFHDKMSALKTLANIKKIDNPKSNTVVDQRQVHVTQVIEDFDSVVKEVDKMTKTMPLSASNLQEDDADDY